MAIFEGLGKKISNAGQSAVQKTKGMSDISKINNLISEEEKKLGNVIFQIGKKYVSKHYNDEVSEFPELIAEIHRLEDAISGYKQQILQIKGLARCERCGAEVPIANAFCSGCGAPMPVRKIEALNTTTCKNCGAVVDKNQRFCSACGNPMQVQPAPQPVPVAPASTPVYAPEADPVYTQQPVAEAVSAQEIPAPKEDDTVAESFDFMRPVITCPNCGSEHDEGLFFCTKCGTKLQ